MARLSRAPSGVAGMLSGSPRCGRRCHAAPHACAIRQNGWTVKSSCQLIAAASRSSAGMTSKMQLSVRVT